MSVLLVTTVYLGL